MISSSSISLGTRKREDSDSYFKRAILISLLLHAVFWGILFLKNRFPWGHEKDMMEVDLTKPFRIGGNPLLKPGGGTSPDVKKIGVPAPPSPVPQQEKPKLQDWVLPGPQTKELVKPQEEGTQAKGKSLYTEPGGTGEGFPGTGGGWGGGNGEGGGYPIESYPKLLNRDEIMKLLRKLYPSSEREAGQEADVVVDVHIKADGSVSSIEIAGSGGQNFDKVAEAVGRRMRFSPAIADIGGGRKGPVAVKIRQAISFHLED